MTHTSMPVRSIPSQQPEMLSSQMPTNSDYSSLHPISESSQPASTMDLTNSLLSAGYPIDQSYMSFNTNSAQHAYGGSNAQAYTDLPMPFGRDAATIDDMDFHFPNYQQGMPQHGLESRAPASSEHSTSHSEASVVPDMTMRMPATYNSWTDAQNGVADITPAAQHDDPFQSTLHNSVAMPTNGLPTFWQNGNASLEAPPMPFINRTASAPVVPSYSTPGHDSEGNMSSDDNADLEPPPVFGEEAFSRRGSGASGASALADGINDIGIHSRKSVENFKQPSIAARRQKRGPANLGPFNPARSASYTAGMPLSPNASQSLTPSHEIRRIRSQGVVNGRVQKPSISQRSPLTPSFFSDNGAMSSPRGRQLSDYISQCPTTGVSGISSSGSLAPPTPLSPSGQVHSHFPSWQTPGVKVIPDGSSSADSGVVVTSMGMPSAQQFMTSPPITPLEAMHLQQQQQQQQLVRPFNPHLHPNHPPQSAPATQQTFSQSFMGQPHSSAESPMPYAAVATHTRRPSLPNSDPLIPGQLPQQMAQYPQVPMVNAAGHLQMAAVYPSQFQQAVVDFHKDHVPSLSVPYLPSSNSSQQQMPDLFVHEYVPPGANKQSSPSGSQSQQPSLRKDYIFANQGPSDYQGKKQSSSS